MKIPEDLARLVLEVITTGDEDSIRFDDEDLTGASHWKF